jgi:hypothetical protein
MKRITLNGGIKVRTFTPPPLGFDPLSASAAELHKHGFPVRPDHPQQLERYKRVFGQMKNRFQYIEPEFKVNKSRRRPPTKPAVGLGSAAVGTGNEFHPFWSGGVVIPPAGQSFRWIVGEWTVPNVGAPTNGQTFYFTSWVGIDGDINVQSTDVCQAGINLDVTGSGASASRHVSAFCEWFTTQLPPQDQHEVGVNFPVTFGDTVIVTICTSGAGATEALIFFANRTSGIGTSFILDAPLANGQQVSLVGDSAQWVVERPALGNALTPALLADYGQLFFSGCQAVSYSADGSSSEVVNGGTQRRIDMIESDAYTIPVPLSDGILVADTVIECLFVAPGTGQF